MGGDDYLARVNEPGLSALRSYQADQNLLFQGRDAADPADEESDG